MQKILTSLLIAWTLTIDGITASPPDRIISYTIRNEAGQVIETGSVTVPLTMGKEAVRNTLRHQLHLKKYPPETPPAPASGQTITLD